MDRRKFISNTALTTTCIGLNGILNNENIVPDGLACLKSSGEYLKNMTF